ncbi:MAG TPA: BatA domain-containing protein [Steroidobacteraceae bacterium]|nr:BatA domain-containing protein [Steroidobacteraceae bacterium]
MGWLAPGFLLGALAVGVPVWLHLLKRSASQPRKFSSLMLFEPQRRSTTRRRRIDHWLLLLLRIAVLLVLAAAFAEPYVRGHLPGSAPPKLLVLAVDVSASMRAGSRMADARRDALAVVAAKARDTQAQVVALGSRADSLTEQVQDAQVLDSAIRGINPTDARGSYALLASLARTLSAGTHMPIEMHLFSDMQATGLPPDFNELRLPPGVTLVLHQVGAPKVANWTVESVAAPSQVWDPTKTRIVATVAGFGTPEATRTVTLSINDRPAGRQSIKVPPSGRASVVFASPDIPYGLVRASVQIDGADALAVDDRYDFVIQRSERVHGLFVHQGSDAATGLYFRSALGSAADAAVILDEATVEQLRNRDLSPYTFIVLSDIAGLPPAVETRVADWVRAGGRALLSAGTAAAQQHRIPVFDAPVLGSHDYTRDDIRFASVASVDEAYAPAGALAGWQGIKVFYVTRVDAPQAEVGLRLADQTPLLLDKPLGKGRVVLLSTGLDRLTTDLPLHPQFVAFIDRLASYLSGRGSRISALSVGDSIDLRPDPAIRGSADVLAPDGTHPLDLRQAAQVRSWPLPAAGFYALTLADSRHDLVAANVSRLESDLTAATPDTLKLWQASNERAATAPGTTPVTGAAPIVRDESVHNLWWYAMCLLLAAVVAESLVASRYLNSLRESSS